MDITPPNQACMVWYVTLRLAENYKLCLADDDDDDDDVSVPAFNIQLAF